MLLLQHYPCYHSASSDSSRFKISQERHSHHRFELDIETLDLVPTCCFHRRMRPGEGGWVITEGIFKRRYRTYFGGEKSLTGSPSLPWLLAYMIFGVPSGRTTICSVQRSNSNVFTGILHL